MEMFTGEKIEKVWDTEKHLHRYQMIYRCPFEELTKAQQNSKEYKKGTVKGSLSDLVHGNFL